MADATRNRRMAIGDPADGDYFANPVLNGTLTLLATSSAGAPAKWPIRGVFEMRAIDVDVVTAANASAKTINIGTSASVARFAAQAVSAGAANERFSVTPASGALADWRSTGSAQGVTTVQAYWTDVSGVAAGARVSIDYILIG